jgi:serine protease SohB
MWAQYSLFLAQTVTLVAGILVTVGGLVWLTRAKTLSDVVNIKPLNGKFNQLRLSVLQQVLDKKGLKAALKQDKLRDKDWQKQKAQRARLFVIDFKGDTKANQARGLREEITAILTVATSKDEVLINLESPGGMVHAYGFAASQLQRVRDRGIPLTVSVDKVAASGGYLMACVADKILAAPFAYIGSIGVLLQLPNFHRLLEEKHIDFEQIKAGELKRTVTMFGKNTSADREKCQQDLEQIHQQFKRFIQRYRPSVDLAQVATGEVWLATQAKALNLVDELITGDDYLLQAADTKALYSVQYQTKKNLAEKLMSAGKVMLIDPLLELLYVPKP